MRIAIICPDFPPARGGLADHTLGLARWLGRRASVDVYTSRSRDGDGSAAELAPSSVRIHRLIDRWSMEGISELISSIGQSGFDWAIFQYVPHMYSRWGFNFGLPIAISEIGAAGVRGFLWVHELFLDWSIQPRRLAAAAAQRMMLEACMAASCRVAISTEVWHRRMVRELPSRSRKCLHLPTPSNFEFEVEGYDTPISRSHRSGLERSITLGFFGTLHDSKLVGHLAASLSALSATGWDAKLLCIGPDDTAIAHCFNGSAKNLRGMIESTGYLPPEGVIRRLQEVDLFLLPLLDGLSTRRGSMMAAMALGLPVIGTEGPSTDPMLRDSGACRMTPVGDVRAFVDAVQSLARDPAKAVRLGEAGRRFYFRTCSWDAVGARLWEAMRSVG